MMRRLFSSKVFKNSLKQSQYFTTAGQHSKLVAGAAATLVFAAALTYSSKEKIFDRQAFCDELDQEEEWLEDFE
jgi:hypothetical protein